MSAEVKRMTTRRRSRVALLALPLLLAAGACENWLTDFKQQPSVGTWQKFNTDSTGETTPFRGNPQGSVPVTGVAVAAWQVGYEGQPLTIDSLSGVANPVAADARSLDNGHKVYAINCAVCHGDLGDGDGTIRQVVPMFAFVPSLLTPMTVERTDGYIFGMMRNGRGLMPSQSRIPERDRWDVVNYLRGLQGRYAVATGAVGFPGQTGSALPGFSAIGPTVPSQYLKPSTVGITPKAEKPKTEGTAPGAHE